MMIRYGLSFLFFSLMSASQTPPSLKDITREFIVQKMKDKAPRAFYQSDNEADQHSYKLFIDPWYDEEKKYPFSQEVQNKTCTELVDAAAKIPVAYFKYKKAFDMSYAKKFDHHSSQTCSLLMHNNRLVSGSRDGKITLWNPDTGELLTEFFGHTDSVNCMQVDDNRLYSASDDKTITIWDLATGKILQRLKKHTRQINCICINDNQLYSGSADATIKVWSIKEGKCIETLSENPLWPVNCIFFNKNLFYSGSVDTTIKVWDIANKNQCLKKFSGHRGAVNSLLIYNSNIVSCSDDHTIKFWNSDTEECIKTIYGHSEAVKSILLNDNILISASQDKRIKVWDSGAEKCIHELETKNLQECILCHDNQLYFSDKESSDYNDNNYRLKKIPAPHSSTKGISIISAYVLCQAHECAKKNIKCDLAHNELLYNSYKKIPVDIQPSEEEYITYQHPTWKDRVYCTMLDLAHYK